MDPLVENLYRLRRALECGLLERDERIAELERENTRLQTDLDNATSILSEPRIRAEERERCANVDPEQLPFDLQLREEDAFSVGFTMGKGAMRTAIRALGDEE